MNFRYGLRQSDGFKGGAALEYFAVDVFHRRCGQIGIDQVGAVLKRIILNRYCCRGGCDGGERRIAAESHRSNDETIIEIINSGREDQIAQRAAAFKNSVDI